MLAAVCSAFVLTVFLLWQFRASESFETESFLGTPDILPCVLPLEVLVSLSSPNYPVVCTADRAVPDTEG